MDPIEVEPTTVCHVVAMPVPPRGRINPVMNLCKLLASKQPNILITFVVTEEWLGFIGSENKPANMRLATVPNVIPSEVGRANNFTTFVEDVNTKMEAPFEELLDRLDPPVRAILGDTFLPWTVSVGNRRNIPVASVWAMSASTFSVLLHFDLLVQNQHFPVDLSETGDELVDYIPGISFTTRVADLLTNYCKNSRQALRRLVESVSWVSKAQYLLLTSFYELDIHAVDTLKAKFSFPVYSVGPTIPYLELDNNSSRNDHNYFQWLDSQPIGSVLYISLESFLSVSSAQMDEIVAGVRDSGVRYLWVARGETAKIQDGCGDMGMVVPWCEQLKVLCHTSIGGFWTHCGWNSTLEAIFAGLPLLTFPIFWDQATNRKQIVEDWKNGWRVKREVGDGDLVTREAIAEIIVRFMDQESNEGREIREKAKELQEMCRRAIGKGGSSETNLDAFIHNIFKGHGH